jgi:hypothetical protein
MDPITILITTLAIAGLTGMAFIGGWELGHNEGTDRERALADRRVNGLLDELNKLKPRTRRQGK